MKSDSRTALRQPCRPPCWTKASISARLAPCTASWNRRENLASAAISSFIRLTKSPSCWPPLPTSFGVGTSPSCAGPVKWTYFYLYVILDVFSRYVTGWMIAYRESAELAKQFIEEAIGKHQIPAGQLTIHADRGRVMKSKPVAFLMADLGVTKSHSRPYVSDDNPYSESQFRTMKYRPEFPGSLRLHPRQPRLLSAVFPVVQRRASPLRHRLAHPCRGSFRRDPSRPGPPPGGARCRLPSAPRPLRSATAQTVAVALGGLDQQAGANPAKRQRKIVSKLPCRVSQSA